MGEAGPSGLDPVGSRSLTATTARVVPNVASFAVDGGFWYSVPPHLTAVGVGTVVRVPLAGRRVRGWVVETATTRPTDGLREIAGVSSPHPVFDHGLAQSMTWAASHYVAPLAVVLAKTMPPNLPKGTETSLPPPMTGQRSTSGPFAQIAREAVQGKKTPVRAVVGRWQKLEWVEALMPILAGGGSVMVVAGTAAEVSQIASRVEPVLGEDRLIALTTDDDAGVTRCWDRSQTPGRLLVGTPRVAAWRVADLRLGVILEEGRRVMKERQTPTIHVRDLMIVRSRVEGFNLVFFGPTPSVELLAEGATIVHMPGRPWSLVEVVDRSDEGPGMGLLSDRVVAAIRATLADPAATIFVLTTQALVPRVVDEVNTRVGGRVAAGGRGDPVVVGTEADMAGLAPVTLAIAPGADYLQRGSGYRGSEEALRQLGRLGALLGAGPGRRIMVQTDDPSSDLVHALRRADPIPYLEKVLVERARLGLPPSTEMLAIELRHLIPPTADTEIAGLGAGEVLGPVSLHDGRRWLLSGDLSRVRPALRSLVAGWREKGTTVRVDADPIDL
ncbi:MAG: hypothetical protein L0Z63_03290 [Actinobacteria bacterium]|nr:hypothetical protein [Actinomycetota bacterium]